MKHIKIYTDGACKGNPGPGGWGALLLWGDGEFKEISGFEPDTTNNRMEMRAVIEALSFLKEPHTIDIYTDSTYVRDGLTTWIWGWMKNNWVTAAKKPVKNKELWQKLLDEKNRHDVKLHWVRGHAGDPGNERADALATGAIQENG